jgi:ATP-dependent Clp protease ATP-binding subunit ClpX
MISQNLKIIFIYTLLASSRVISMDSGIMPRDDSSTAAPRNSTVVSATDDPFGKLMRTLNFLSVSKGKIEPWKNAISAYQQSLSDNAEISTLVSIREKILGEPLAKRRMAMVNRAFSSLTDDSTAPVAFAPMPCAPMQIIVFQTPATRERPVLSSETRKRVTAKPPILSSVMEGRASLVGQQAIPAQAIKAHMMSFIAGQDDSLEELSSLAHRFLCNKLLVDRGGMPASNPSHCILTGPTGCGKSESLKQLGLFLGVPILNINARSLTDEGFKGQNFSECVSSFCEENGNPKSAIIAIDEIDKLAARGDDEARNFGRAVQRVLLSPLDGNSISLKGKRFDLTNWWFIGTGAFSGLKGRHDTEGERVTTARTQQDIISAGFEPEFVGRFPSVIAFKGHTIATMMDVIERDGSPLKRIQNEFKHFYGVNLTIEAAALRRLASTSIEINLGVRSLYTILNMALQPFYGQAIELIAVEGEASLVATLKDIMPAITRYIADNKEPREVIPKHLQHMYL